MSGLKLNDVQNDTLKFFYKLNKFWSIVGLTDLWIVDVYKNKIIKYYHRMTTACILTLILFEFGALNTQSHLTEKQSNDLIVFVFTHPIIFTYYIGLKYYKNKVKKLFIMLYVTLKIVYNNPQTERRMIRSATFYSTAYVFFISFSLISYGFDGLLQVIRSGGSFTTVITAWPDIEDNSLIANLIRVLNYLVWWALMARVSAASTLTIITSVAISHQYRNLQKYFHSLNDLFETDDVQTKHEEVESKYVEALKVGIKLHSDTMWCTRQCQVVCSVVYSGQILITIYALCLLMLQMVGSERTLGNVLAIASTMLAVLICTGMMMLNAGDITVEAALIPNAMYSSGWHNCRGATSAKVRRLLVLAMMQGQKFTVLRSFGVVEISYQSYLSIVKSSYSGFSLLY
ncbi:unnamed protein product [Euphydryas editha]|uniref:Odorant receptor n=1 Tax=Euphydryas editha TaxID=104508 RepID=A0AAU9V1M9_EUPED|nr:unnamed protein product [Euphydryas editha]